MTRDAHVLEIRSYELKSGGAERFHQLFVRECVPLLRRWHIDVIAFGPSLHGENAYFLMRAFSNLEHRRLLEDSFYASTAWRNGPRAAVLDLIATYTTVVIEADSLLLQALRHSVAGPVIDLEA